MKTCVVRKRFYATASLNEGGVATTVDLDPGFGTPKACVVYYAESNQSQDGFFDTSTTFRTCGIGFIGSTDSTITSSLSYRCAYVTQIDGVAATGVTVLRRQNQTNRWMTTGETSGAVYWQGTQATFSSDQVTFLTTGSSVPTSNHLDCVFVFFTGNDLNVGVGNSQFPSTAGASISMSRLSFQPDVALIASSITTAGQGLTDDNRLAYGCATRSPYKQKGIYWHNDGQQLTRVQLAALSSSTLITNYWTNNSVGPYFFSLSSFSASGWAITAGPTVPTASQDYIYMALQTSTPTDFALVDLQTYPSTGNTFVGLGVSGFVPRTVLGALTSCTTDNSRATTSPQADGFTLFAGHKSKYSVFYNGTGTISVTSGSSTITGVNSEFNRLNQGDILSTIGGTTLGTIGSVTSKTSASFVGTAPFSLTSQSYLLTKPNQYYVAFGNSNNATTTQVYSSIGGTLVFTSRSSGTVPTYLDTGTLSATDSSPEVLLNYSATSGSSRLGWLLAIKDPNDNRRRGGIS